MRQHLGGTPQRRWFEFLLAPIAIPPGPTWTVPARPEPGEDWVLVVRRALALATSP